MKTLITSYSFNAAAKQITFTEPITLEQLLLITNVTDNLIIYNFANPAAGGSINEKTLTLTYNTTGMSDTDQLQIFADIDDTDYKESLLYLTRMISKSTTYARDNNDRMRVVMDNNPMLYTYMRNSGSSMNASTEGWYSISSWNIVDAREQITSIQNNIVAAAIQRWRVM